MPPWHREVRGDYMTLILGLSKPHGIYLSVNYRMTDSRTAQPHAYTHLHSPLMTLKQVQRIPFLHWSFLRTATRIWNVPRTGQFGDGREAAAVEYVLQNAQAGDLDDVLAAIGRFAHEKAFLVNIGDEKGALLDAAVQRANPKLALELGAVWAGGTVDPPPDPLDAAIVFAPAGEIVPAGLKALKKGGSLVLGGIHMSTIPPLNYDLLYEERVIRSVANNTRQDGHDFLRLAAQIPVHAETEVFPLAEANRALNSLKNDAIRGAAVLQVR